ncbi:MAG: hypothetical protein PHO67_04530 [Candidatus Omnitrophica bacterium]|nr:hypothetical protein [Candidatus Omnitrophota bacterium]
MKRLTPACRSFLYYLMNQYTYFSKNGKLAGDGSFFKADSEAAGYLGVCPRTIKRCRGHLKEIGKIKAAEGKWSGNATRYWLLEKDDKMSPFQSGIKDDKLSAKVDKLSNKGCQNVTPNKEKKEINQETLNDLQIQEMHNAFQETIKKSFSK